MNMIKASFSAVKIIFAIVAATATNYYRLRLTEIGGNVRYCRSYDYRQSRLPSIVMSLYCESLLLNFTEICSTKSI